MAHAGLTDGVHIEASAFQDDMLGLVRDFSLRAAHHAADADWFVAVGDNNVTAGQSRGFAVQ